MRHLHSPWCLTGQYEDARYGDQVSKNGFTKHILLGGHLIAWSNARYSHQWGALRLCRASHYEQRFTRYVEKTIA